MIAKIQDEGRKFRITNLGDWKHGSVSVGDVYTIEKVYYESDGNHEGYMRFNEEPHISWSVYFNKNAYDYNYFEWEFVEEIKLTDKDIGRKVRILELSDYMSRGNTLKLNGIYEITQVDKMANSMQVEINNHWIDIDSRDDFYAKWEFVDTENKTTSKDEKPNSVINNNNNQNNNMSILNRIKKLIEPEPMKSFKKYGIYSEEGNLTTEGKELILNFIAEQKDAQDYLKDIVKNLKKEEDSK